MVERGFLFMEKYYRKIVQLKFISKDGVKGFKGTASYCKLEKRNERHKLSVVIEGTGLNAHKPFVICMVLERNQKYIVKDLRTLLYAQNKINDVILLDEQDVVHMVGIIVLQKTQDRPVNYPEDILFVGYLEEEFNLDQLNGQGDGEIDNPINGAEINENEKKTQIESSQTMRTEIEVNVGETSKPEEIESKVAPVEVKENNEKIHKTLRKESKQVLESLDEIKKQMDKREIEEIIDDIFKTNQKMSPFENDDPNFEWIKIEITDLVFLPIESWMYINNAFLMTNYRKYKHLLLGRKKGEKSIKIGVPDVYYFKGSIVANLCGFYEFTSCKNALPKAGEYGYWLVKTSL